jgi:hypothetical protein
LPSWAVRFRSRFASAKAEAQQTPCHMMPHTVQRKGSIAGAQSGYLRLSVLTIGVVREDSIPLISLTFSSSASLGMPLLFTVIRAAIRTFFITKRAVLSLF